MSDSLDNLISTVNTRINNENLLIAKGNEGLEDKKELITFDEIEFTKKITSQIWQQIDVFTKSNDITIYDTASLYVGCLDIFTKRIENSNIDLNQLVSSGNTAEVTAIANSSFYQALQNPLLFNGKLLDSQDNKISEKISKDLDQLIADYDKLPPEEQQKVRDSIPNMSVEQASKVFDKTKEERKKSAKLEETKKELDEIALTAKINDALTDYANGREPKKLNRDDFISYVKKQKNLNISIGDIIKRWDSCYSQYSISYERQSSKKSKSDITQDIRGENVCQSDYLSLIAFIREQNTLRGSMDDNEFYSQVQSTLPLDFKTEDVKKMSKLLQDLDNQYIQEYPDYMDDKKYVRDTSIRKVYKAVATREIEPLLESLYGANIPLEFNNFFGYENDNSEKVNEDKSFDAPPPRNKRLEIESSYEKLTHVFDEHGEVTSQAAMDFIRAENQRFNDILGDFGLPNGITLAPMNPTITENFDRHSSNSSVQSSVKSSNDFKLPKYAPMSPIKTENFYRFSSNSPSSSPFKKKEEPKTEEKDSLEGVHKLLGDDLTGPDLKGIPELTEFILDKYEEDKVADDYLLDLTEALDLGDFTNLSQDLIDKINYDELQLHMGSKEELKAYLNQILELIKQISDVEYQESHVADKSSDIPIEETLETISTMHHKISDIGARASKKGSLFSGMVMGSTAVYMNDSSSYNSKDGEDEIEPDSIYILKRGTEELLSAQAKDASISNQDDRLTGDDEFELDGEQGSSGGEYHTQNNQGDLNNPQRQAQDFDLISMARAVSDGGIIRSDLNGTEKSIRVDARNESSRNVDNGPHKKSTGGADKRSDESGNKSGGADNKANKSGGTDNKAGEIGMENPDMEQDERD